VPKVLEGLAYAALDQPSDAAARFEGALALDPGFMLAAVAVGECCFARPPSDPSDATSGVTLIARSHGRSQHASLVPAIGSSFSELQRRGCRSRCGARLAIALADLGRFR